MSILKVDTINEKTTGNGVAIPGHVVQTVTSTNTLFTSTQSSTYADLITVSFTPKFNNSSLIISCVCRYQENANNRNAKVKILHDGTQLMEVNSYLSYGGGNNNISTVPVTGFVSSTGSTAARDIDLQMAVYGVAGQTLYINPNSTNGTCMYIQEIAQ
tara:strand:+ start:208 stop:681 length:474 start_codon:yes stop_codon:yes gene_type:complete